MSASRPLTVGAGIIAVGVLAALPFARFGGSSAPARPAPSPGFGEVPLHLTAESAPSPAVGLHDHDAPLSSPSASRLPVLTESRLEVSGAPPNLPERYEPLVDTPPVLSPTPATPPAVAPAPLRPMRGRGPLRLEEPRLRVRPAESDAEEIGPPPAREQTHRIVDGDTLARIAQRYWGDAKLADALLEANRDVLPAADPLPLGVVLKIPPKPALPASSTPDALPAQPVSQPKLTPAADEPEEAPPQVEELPPPVRQPMPPRNPSAEEDVAEDEPLVPIPSGALRD